MSINFKKLTTAISAVAVMGMFATDAFAGTKTYIRDKNGNTIGSTYTQGNTTYIRDKNGNNIGSIRR
jgi:hypothetical protein